MVDHEEDFASQDWVWVSGGESEPGRKYVPSEEEKLAGKILLIHDLILLFLPVCGFLGAVLFLLFRFLLW